MLDEALKPAAEGELAISGDGVAEGYHHQPALTAARFVPDPFWTGKRMYLTGDRARLMANGEVDLLGRLDDQVKIRGHRIELGDVEATLLTHGAIASAACVVVGDEAEKRIIACVAAKPGVAPDEAALQTFLRGALPEAYRPARVLVLDALPLNSSQKIDRPALKTLVTTLL